ncbi:MAG: hypothetical protein IH591_17690 [Bacteroidales bacterium]|nr:hypothetical protein [Bacteroidales bacterium]
MRQVISETILKSKLTVPLLLGIQFGLHLLLYFNTEVFSGISESGVLLGKLDSILQGARPKPLFGFYWYFTPAYIASFFIRVFGSIDFYFVFQCLVATATSLALYFAVVKISGSKISGLVALIFSTLYTEFILLSSVFYNQVYENLFVLLLLLVILKFADGRSAMKYTVYGVMAIVIVTVSLMFRNTLLVVFSLMIIVGIFYLTRRQTRTGIGFISLAFVLFALVFVIRPLDLLREGDYSPPGMLEFWGHTPYGGNGGEVGFIYEENEALFNKRLDEYVNDRDIEEVTTSVIEEFKKYETRRFISQEPHRWIFLQVRKVLYTFGIMPQRDGLTMLMTGRVQVGWVMATVLLQAPFLLLMILFVLTFDLKINEIFNLPGYKFLLYLLGLYLVAAVSVYGAWAERYRVVVMMGFIIPVIAINIGNLKRIICRNNRKELTIRLFLAGLLLLSWGYQAYEALVIHRDRYFDAIDKIVQ